MTRLILLGPPGAGKGTQAAILAEKLGVAHISTGEILRQEVQQHTELGSKAKLYMDKGELVPDHLILEMVKGSLLKPESSPGWILDGFPRNVSQAEFLDRLLEDIHQACTQVINLDVPDEILVERLLARGRKDDTEEVLRHRLVVYHNQTKPLIDFYRDRQLLTSVNGNQSLEGVTSNLAEVLT